MQFCSLQVARLGNARQLPESWTQTATTQDFLVTNKKSQIKYH